MTETPDVGRMINLLERFVAIDKQNLPGNEAQAAAMLASELSDHGFATELRTVAEGRALRQFSRRRGAARLRR